MSFGFDFICLEAICITIMNWRPATMVMPKPDHLVALNYKSPVHKTIINFWMLVNTIPRNLQAVSEKFLLHSRSVALGDWFVNPPTSYPFGCDTVGSESVAHR